jgi:hypothetical protein
VQIGGIGVGTGVGAVVGVAGTSVGGTAVGGTLVGGTEVGGTAVGGSTVAAGPHAVNSITAANINDTNTKTFFIFLLLSRE